MTTTVPTAPAAVAVAMDAWKKQHQVEVNGVPVDGLGIIDDRRLLVDPPRGWHGPHQPRLHAPFTVEIR